MESKISLICQTSKDEDEISDISNDLIEVRLLLKSLKSKAISQYGASIMNFSRESFLKQLIQIFLKLLILKNCPLPTILISKLLNNNYI
jgi:hypothetical protein